MAKRKRKFTLDEIAANVDAILNAPPKRNKDGSIRKTPGRKMMISPEHDAWAAERLKKLQEIYPEITNPYYGLDPLEVIKKIGKDGQ